MKINQMEPNFDEKEKKALMKYMDSGGYLTEFKKTHELEQKIADFVGTKYCILVPNGTISLSLALWALDDKRKEVLVPDYTMIATANAVKMAGLKPVLVDIEPKTLGMDFGDFLAKVDSRTHSIMLVSINGRFPDHGDEILSYCRDHNINVIEDSAQCLGSYYKGKHIGTFGDVGSFSFSMPKIISMGQGGAIVTDNRHVYTRIKWLKNFGREVDGVDKHEHLGYNFKFTDLQAVIGIEQMKKLPNLIKHKKKIYRTYKDLLDGRVDFIRTESEVTPWMNDILFHEREVIRRHLFNYEIGTRPFYPPIHTQYPYNIKFQEHFFNSEFISERGIWLPSSTKLTEKEVEYICEKILEVVK